MFWRFWLPPCLRQSDWQQTYSSVCINGNWQLDQKCHVDQRNALRKHIRVYAIIENKFLLRFILRDLRFSQKWIQRLLSSGMWHRVVWYICTIVSEEHSSTLKMIEATGSFEILVTFSWITQQHFPEDSNFSFIPHLAILKIITFTELFHFKNLKSFTPLLHDKT